MHVLTELQKRIKLEKTLIIAACEVKPKNPHERTEPDYVVSGYSMNPVNLDSSIGKGVVIHTHSSLDKSVIQIIPEIAFEEVWLLEIRLRGGDLVLFDCFYRSHTPSISSDRNNDNENRLLRYASGKSHGLLYTRPDMLHSQAKANRPL